MKTTWQFGICLAMLVLSTGCRRAAPCTVTEYGPEYLTYTGSHEEFSSACRQVLNELGYSEKVDENTTRHPYHAEGSSSHNQSDRVAATKAYMQTKDKDGAEYKIVTLILGTRDPVVILESTSSDRHKLINALNAEFQKRGIKVQQY